MIDAETIRQLEAGPRRLGIGSWWAFGFMWGRYDLYVRSSDRIVETCEHPGAVVR